MIELEAVSVELGGRLVLRELSLRVAPGELLALVGPNGAGKSTALAAIAGALSTSGGEIRFHDRPLRAWDAEELARARAVMTQSEFLTFAFLVRDVVAMGRHPHPPSDADEETVDAAAREARVSHLLDRRYTALSGGERQRVRFARVLTQLGGVEQGALLLDEPTASLDPAEQHACMAAARRQARAGRAVVVVLHDLGLAARYADRMAVLDDGRLLGEGTPREVVGQGILDEAFDVQVRLVPHEGPHPTVLVEPRAAGEDSGRA
ncbi:MAG: heme ABC transporter ATP-binding protein [Planctomycetota bacterium]